jgi:hypothetical protein
MRRFDNSSVSAEVSNTCILFQAHVQEHAQVSQYDSNISLVQGANCQ